MTSWKRSPLVLEFFRECSNLFLSLLTPCADTCHRDRSNHPEGSPPFVLPHLLPQPPKKVKARLSTTPLSSPVKATKRRAPDEDSIMEGQPAKRLKTSANGNELDPSTPRKKRQLEEDGLIILDGPEEGQDDGVGIIVID